MVRILVTGASGYLGQYVVAALAKQHDVVATDMKAADGISRLDIMDLDGLTAAFAGIDCVIHLAAMANIFAGTAEQVMSVNTLGCWNIFEAAQRSSVTRVVLCSSDSASGYTLRPDLMHPPETIPLPEAFPGRPTDPYGLSKKAGEIIAQSYADRRACEVIVLRPVYILYPRVEDEIRRRAKDPAKYSPSPDPHSPKAGGGPFWHYISPEDAADAFALAATKALPQSFSIFTIAADETLHPLPTLERARELFGVDVPVTQPKLYQTRPHAPFFDMTATREILGFKPKINRRHDFV